MTSDTIHCDILIIGSGPAGLGAAFELIEKNKTLKIIMVDREKICSGGLLNDCKQNYTYPIGFTEEYWTKEEAEKYLLVVENHLKPNILPLKNLSTYEKRAERVKSTLLSVKQAHVGTNKSKDLIKGLIKLLEDFGVTVRLEQLVTEIDHKNKTVHIDNLQNEKQCKIKYDKIIIAPGRKGFSFLQNVMNKLEIPYIDNTVDIGIRVETRLEHYPIVKDFYDPKFYFPNKVRTFCTNSGHALVTRETYQDFLLVNGHALSKDENQNGLVNFALLKTIGLKDPVRSGQQMAVYLAQLANAVGGGKPIMQRVGDFRMGKRSNNNTFNDDLYDFKPTYNACAGDLGLVVPSKIMRDIWRSMKLLDTIIPGILHPSTIMYYPEIKMYANKPTFIDQYFQAQKDIYLIGDGAGTSRGITGAWASGARAATGILQNF